jgi:ABC-type multidrug transport system permease subunit
MTRQRNKPKCNEGRNNIVVRMRHGIVYSNIKKFCPILSNENLFIYFITCIVEKNQQRFIEFDSFTIILYRFLFYFLFFSLLYLVLLHAVLSRCVIVIVIVIVIVFVYLFIIYSRFPFFAALP